MSNSMWESLLFEPHNRLPYGVKISYNLVIIHQIPSISANMSECVDWPSVASGIGLEISS